MKIKFESASIAVQDLDRAIEFYEWFLDRKVSSRGKFLTKFELDNMDFVLFDSKNSPHDTSYGDNCILNFEVEDVESCFRAIKEKNLEVTLPLMKMGGRVVFIFKDTEGNQIEVFSLVWLIV